MYYGSLGRGSTQYGYVKYSWGYDNVAEMNYKDYEGTSTWGPYGSSPPDKEFSLDEESLQVFRGGEEIPIKSKALKDRLIGEIWHSCTMTGAKREVEWVRT